jgi:hypothetical protein
VADDRYPDAEEMIPNRGKIPARAASTGLMLATVVFLLAFADDKFEMVSERQIPAMPSGVRDGGFGALSSDGKSVLTVRAGRLTIRPLESLEEKELLSQGTLSLATGSGAWASWSGDGKWIYYLQRSDRPWINNLWRLHVADLKKELLINNAGGVGVSTPSPLPSPDDKNIVFYRGETAMLTHGDGRSARVLLEHGQSRVLVWSPDSSQILFVEGPYPRGATKLNLLTVGSGQVRPLATITGYVTSTNWPSWSSGPFLCVLEPAPDPRSRPTVGKIWHLSLPYGELTEVTHGPSSYISIFGAGASGYSLVAQRLPMPSGWKFFQFIGLPSWSKRTPFQPTVILTLKK